MAPQDAEFVRLIFDEFPRTQERLRQGTQRIGPPLSKDIVWDASEVGLPDLGDGVLRGYEGVRRFWMEWLSAWEDVSFEYELRTAGDHVVVLIDQQNQVSQISLPLVYAQVWTFRDGEVVHWKLYRDPGDALKAAGLEG